MGSTVSSNITTDSYEYVNERWKHSDSESKNSDGLQDGLLERLEEVQKSLHYVDFRVQNGKLQPLPYEYNARAHKTPDGCLYAWCEFTGYSWYKTLDMDKFEQHSKINQHVADGGYGIHAIAGFHNFIYFVSTVSQTVGRWDAANPLADPVFYDIPARAGKYDNISIAVADCDQVVMLVNQTLYRITAKKPIKIKEVNIPEEHSTSMQFISDNTLMIQTTPPKSTEIGYSRYVSALPHKTVHEVRGIFDPPAQVLREVFRITNIDPGSMSVVAQYI
jgi:hypothetical protein